MKGIFSAVAFLIVAGFLAMSIFGLPLLAIWIALMLVGAVDRARKAETKIATTLMADEKIVTQAIQKRIFALFNRRSVLAITSSRVILLKRGLLGGFTMTDIQWKDLKDVRMEQNVLEEFCGSNLVFLHLNMGAGAVAMDGVKSDIASAMYARAQSEEQQWEEKRRVRTMEEVRAAAGGVVVHAPAPATAPVATENRMLKEIQQAAQLHESGVISDAEFQEMKAKILATA